VAEQFPLWVQVREGQLPASEVREGYIHSHGVALQAIGNAGNALLHSHPNDWKIRLGELKKIDWSRKNTKVWEGRAMIGGKVSKVSTNIVLTANVIKKALSLRLTEEEQKIETMHTHRGKTYETKRG
jgi:DNA sulfur modification protein DndB